MQELNKQTVFELLNTIPDPEIPVISIVELGIVRDAIVTDNAVEVFITPTYSGCPAMYEISTMIGNTLRNAGASDVTIKTVLAPVWTTDWMNDDTKEKLRIYGIAPPMDAEPDGFFNIIKKERPVPCPFCNSSDTAITSRFGSTACKSFHKCNHCSQVFEYFKCH